jgi:hypothetical protein
LCQHYTCELFSHSLKNIKVLQQAVKWLSSLLGCKVPTNPHVVRDDVDKVQREVIEFEKAHMPSTMHKILFLLTPFWAASSEEYIQHSPVYGNSLPCVSAQKCSGQPMGKFLMTN